MTEKDLEQRLVREVKKRDGLCLKFTSPGTSGVPDRLVILPPGEYYSVGFVEVKKPGQGRLSKLQRFWLRRLKVNFQIPAFVLDDPSQIESILNEIQTT